jgi:putative transposase
VSHKSQRYTSDLTDEQWERLKGLLPLENDGRGRPLELDMREVLNALFYVARTGCQWRNLPSDFPNYNSVYYHYRKWCRNGTWRKINRYLVWLRRHQQGRCPYPSAAIIDTQSVKTTESGGERGYDAGKKINGRKRHLLVDTVGNMLDVAVHAANLQDRTGAKQLMNKLPSMIRQRLQMVWADRGYRGLLEMWFIQQLAITLQIVSPEPGQKGFAVLPKRWIVERSFAWLGRYRRLSKDYEHCLFSSEGMIYLVSIHSSLRRLCSP